MPDTLVIEELKTTPDEELVPENDELFLPNGIGRVRKQANDESPSPALLVRFKDERPGPRKGFQDFVGEGFLRGLAHPLRAPRAVDEDPLRVRGGALSGIGSRRSFHRFAPLVAGETVDLLVDVERRDGVRGIRARVEVEGTEPTFEICDDFGCGLPTMFREHDEAAGA